MSTLISVLIADDHAMVRAGLRLLLESHRDIRVVGECGTHVEVLNTLAKCREPIDVVTLDVTMPGGSAARLIQEIVHQNSGTRVIVLEDTATTGGSAIKAVNTLREGGFDVIGVLAICDRLEGAAEAMAEAKLPFRALYTRHDFIAPGT